MPSLERAGPNKSTEDRASSERPNLAVATEGALDCDCHDNNHDYRFGAGSTSVQSSSQPHQSADIVPHQHQQQPPGTIMDSIDIVRDQRVSVKRGLQGKKKKDRVSQGALKISHSTATVIDPSTTTKMGLRHGRPTKYARATTPPTPTSVSSRKGLSQGFATEKFNSDSSFTTSEVPDASEVHDTTTDSPSDNNHAISVRGDIGEDIGTSQPDDDYFIDPVSGSEISMEPAVPSVNNDGAESTASTNSNGVEPGPILLTARLVEENEDAGNAAQSLVVVARATQWKDYMCNRYVVACTMVGVLVFVAVVTAVVATTANSGSESTPLNQEDDPSSRSPTLSPIPNSLPTHTPSDAPTQDPLYTILPEYTKIQIDLDRNATTPQTMAFNWLNDHPDMNGATMAENPARALQLFGLATLFYATQGATSWSGFPDGRNNWLDYETKECEWDQSDGETADCDANGLFQRLKLERVNLQGYIPPEISLLSSLKYLQLRINSLHGTIPEEMFQLTQLTYLDVFSNHMSGSMSTQLKNMAMLTHLNLNANDLTGPLPTSIGQLSDLSLLTVTTNDLSGSIPSEIGLLTKLTLLQLSTNQLSGSIPTTIGTLTLLRRFKAVENNLIGTIPEKIGDLTSLTSLALSANSLVGSIPSQLGLLTALSVLMLRNNNCSGSIPSEFGNLTQLKTLWLEGNELLSGNVPSELCNNSWGTSQYETDGLRADCGRVNCSCAVCQCSGD